MADPQWFYCLTHHVVEPYEAGKAADRLGPYVSPEEGEAPAAEVIEGEISSADRRGSMRWRSRSGAESKRSP